VVNWFGALPGKIINAVKEFGIKFARWIHDSWESMVRVQDEMFQAVWNWFKSLPGKILTALGDAGTWLVDVGKNIVSGLWNGIKSGWSWLVNSVKNLASSLLSGVKDALKIFSPSRAFADQVGKMIPAGIAVGIDGNMEPLKKSIGTMSTSMLVGAKSGPITRNFSPNAQGGVVVNLTVNGSVHDKNSLKRDIQTMFLQQGALNTTTGLQKSYGISNNVGR
jgi:phage-related protein